MSGTSGTIGKTPDFLRLLAPAKINVFLRVTGKRPDGYHNVDSLMQKISLFDELELQKTASGLELHCPGSELPIGPENLVYRAAALFLERWPQDFGLRLTLQKRIPLAAGLGGGSSDAAITLLGLRQLAGLEKKIGDAELAALALRLGADLPFFVQPAPAAHAGGVGEILQAVAPLAGCKIVLVNPGIAVSTKWVYQNLDLTSAGLGDSFPRSCMQWRGLALVNDLERVTIGRYPAIGAVKDKLLQAGADAALMSGSGATVFGLFGDSALAESALRSFQQKFTHTYLIEPLHEENVASV